MKYDFWQVDGSPDFGLIRGGVRGITEQDAPIRLQRGDPTFGALHIETKHGHWVKRQRATVPELVWQKCRQPGSIYSTEEAAKEKIWLPVHPSALMLLRYIQARNFWTIVSLYFHEGPLDGELLGHYKDALAAPAAAPVFTIPAPPPPPKIRIKRRRI